MLTTVGKLTVACCKSKIYDAANLILKLIDGCREKKRIILVWRGKYWVDQYLERKRVALD